MTRIWEEAGQRRPHELPNSIWLTGATEVTLCGLHGDMAKEELNLLQLAASGAAEPSATSTEIVRRKFANADPGSELLDDMPDELFSYSFFPNATGATHMAEKPAPVYSGGPCPLIQ